jgi:hypothetical protein
MEMFNGRAIENQTLFHKKADRTLDLKNVL